MSKMKVTKIVLETKKGKEVVLTTDEAHDLYEELKTLFGKKTEYVPSAPIVIERNRRWNVDLYPPYRPQPFYYTTSTSTTPEPDPNRITCSNVSANSGLKLSYTGDTV